MQEAIAAARQLEKGPINSPTPALSAGRHGDGVFGSGLSATAETAPQESAEPEPR